MHTFTYTYIFFSIILTCEALEVVTETNISSFMSPVPAEVLALTPLSPQRETLRALVEERGVPSRNHQWIPSPLSSVKKIFSFGSPSPADVAATMETK